MTNDVSGAFSPEDVAKTKALVALAPSLEQYRNAVIVPVDKKKGVPRIDRAYFQIPSDFEAGDDVDTGVGSPVKITLLKLLQSNSTEIVAEKPHEGAKIGALWNTSFLEAYPQPLKVVPLYGYSVDFSKVPSKFSNDKSNDGPTWVMVCTTLEALELWPNWIQRVTDPMEYMLGNELLSQMFEMYFSGGSQQVFTEIQGQTLAGAGFNGRAYSWSTKKVESADGKHSWRKLISEPNRLLTEEEKIVSRSLSAIAKEVVGINEQFYEYRAAQFAASQSGGGAKTPAGNTAYDASADNVPPVEDGGM